MILHIPDATLVRSGLDRFGRPIPPFDWHRWEYHVSTLVGIAVLAILYLWAIGPMRRRLADAEPVPPWRIASFFLGLTVAFFALNGPIHDLSDYYLFSVHMAQHLMLTQLMPPLLLLGVPNFALSPLVRPRWVQSIAGFLTRPAVAFALFTLSFTGWHVQPAYDLMMRNHNVHIVTHVQFMVTAVIMWWPILSPMREFPRLPHGGQMLYLFLIGVPMMLVAAMITLADVVLYPWYSGSPRVLGITPLDDQRYGGMLMWVPGGLFYWAAMSIVYFAWVKREGENDAREAREREAAAAER
ncbi:MAG: cytochrome c oxidase assembly protein [Candidatus Eisenbacteria bacterium]|uniref:Cytochrome c oxidase assembly protein n=1 Tax=Eiseniibacteriota bacterium TaxID=2212470 RepID=A0A9D6L7L5_UNCEI|nr:cytochrome c oxidase assembly protein [Candidatus Eisenbacteria bacterium]MBI3540106.1 cytochrome c oxidase assembly protein [Candidatus Eisenbacteria bacterium]